MCAKRMSPAALLPALVIVAAASPIEGRGALTAREIVARIQSHVGVPWQAETVDTFKAGDPDTPITGIAVTMMATLEVLQRAAAAKANLVITHEPTFFDHRDGTEKYERERDPVYLAKQDFIRKNNLVLWRFHDHWHRRTPDGIQAGVASALGWTRYQHADDQLRFTLPETTLDRLAIDIQHKLGAAVVRAVGPGDMRVTEIALAPGAWGFDNHRPVLQREDVQVLIIGEAQEWETIEYVADAVAAGQGKALLAIGHVPSEQPGMDDCARWLKTFVTEVPVHYLPSPDLFRVPR